MTDSSYRMLISRRALRVIVAEEAKRIKEAGAPTNQGRERMRTSRRGRPASSFSQLQPGVAFAVRPATQRMGQRPKPALRLTVTSVSPYRPNVMPARLEAVDGDGRRYSMTDDTGKGTELYLVHGERVVWSGSIDYVEIVDG